MHLSQVTLTNFRCFDALTVKLHPRLTVLVAENAGGKTAVLEAIAKGLSAWNTHFSSADQRLESIPITDEDLHTTLKEGRSGKLTPRTSDHAAVLLRMQGNELDLPWDVSHSRTPESLPSDLIGSELIKPKAIEIRKRYTTGMKKSRFPFSYTTTFTADTPTKRSKDALIRLRSITPKGLPR